MLDLKQTDRMLRKLERFVDIIEPMIFEKAALCPALLGRSKRLHRHRPWQRLLWRQHHPHLLRHRRAAGDLNHTEHIS